MNRNPLPNRAQRTDELVDVQRVGGHRQHTVQLETQHTVDVGSGGRRKSQLGCVDSATLDNGHHPGRPLRRHPRHSGAENWQSPWRGPRATPPVARAPSRQLVPCSGACSNAPRPSSRREPPHAESIGEVSAQDTSYEAGGIQCGSAFLEFVAASIAAPFRFGEEDRIIPLDDPQAVPVLVHRTPLRPGGSSHLPTGRRRGSPLSYRHVSVW